MKQTTRAVYVVTIEYDDEVMDEHEAQEIALQGFPGRIRCNDMGYRGTVGVAHIERAAGGVDEDCVPVQPRVTRELVGRLS